jgi:hypothetical protein
MAVESADDRAALLGSAVLWTHGEATTEIVGWISAPTTAHGIGAPGLVMPSASLLCAEAEIPAGAAEDDEIEHDGTRWFVRALMPDGTGLVRAQLQATYPWSLDFTQVVNSQHMPLI